MCRRRLLSLFLASAGLVVGFVFWGWFRATVVSRLGMDNEERIQRH